jgi:HEPN domain-containing protein
MNAKDRIKNWQNESKADLESASNYINKGRLLHGLFLCHLAIEKTLKALIVNITNNAAPKTHDILELAQSAKIKFTKEELSFINILIKYKLHGRYPKGSSEIPSKNDSNNLCAKSKTLIKKITKLL